MFKLKDFPTEISISLYEKQTKEFCATLENFFWEIPFSIYSLWESDLPGVSDIDFLIIWANWNIKKRILQEIKKYNLIDLPIFISWDKVSDIPYLSHHNSLTYISGKKLDDVFFRDKWRELSLIYAWKVLFFSWLRNLYIPFLTKKISIKSVLNHINDLRYPIKYISSLTILDSDIESFCIEFKDFRKNWYLHKDTEKLVFFLEQSINISWRLIEILDSLMINENWNQNQTSLMYGRFPTLFKKETEFSFYKKGTELFLKKYSNNDRFLILPSSMDYRFWDDRFTKELKLILQINPQFLPFWFQKFHLSLLLQLKKFFDFFKIHLYIKKYEKN